MNASLTRPSVVQVVHNAKRQSHTLATRLGRKKILGYPFRSTCLFPAHKAGQQFNNLKDTIRDYDTDGCTRARHALCGSDRADQQVRESECASTRDVTALRHRSRPERAS